MSPSEAATDAAQGGLVIPKGQMIPPWGWMVGSPAVMSYREGSGGRSRAGQMPRKSFINTLFCDLGTHAKRPR